jgi:hypothetical protein
MNVKFGMITAVFTLTILILAACAAGQREPAAATESDEGDSGGVQVLASGTLVPPTRAPIKVDLPDMGAAPEILNDTWLNTDAPITIESSRGKVVLVEFWTFG